MLSALLNLGCSQTGGGGGCAKSARGRGCRMSSSRCSARRWSWCADGDRPGETRAIGFAIRQSKTSVSWKRDCVRSAWRISPANLASRRICRSPSTPPANAARRWTTCCSTALRAWAKRRSPPSSRRNWKSVSSRPRARCCRRSSIFPAFSAASSRARFFSSMKFIACFPTWRRCSTPRSKISISTS